MIFFFFFLSMHEHMRDIFFKLTSNILAIHHQIVDQQHIRK